MAHRPKFTPKKRERFLDALRDTGNVTKAAESVGISRRAAYDHRQANADFAAQWEDAWEESTDKLEAEARRRAFAGVEEPVFYQGEKCGVIQRYSDTLLIFLLKAHRPEKYRENIRHEHGGAGGGPIQFLEIITPALGASLTLPETNGP